MGMRGEGGFNALIRSWRHVPGPNSRTQARKVRRTLDMHLGATDANDPIWDRFYSWPSPRLRVGDRVEVRVARGTPEKPKFNMKYHRLHDDEAPFPENPTLTVVGDVATWADRKHVNLKAWNKSHQPVSLTPAAARSVAKALVKAARRIERRSRK